MMLKQYEPVSTEKDQWCNKSYNNFRKLFHPNKNTPSAEEIISAEGV